METIELREFGRILGKRLWIIALIVVVGCTVAGFYGFMLKKPVYQASTKLIVNQSVENNSQIKEMNQGLINANIMLIETYKEIIRTNAIMDLVVERYPELNLSAEQLMGRVQVSSVNGTQVMTVYAQDGSYEKAVDIVNSVAQVFKDTIPTIMNIDNVEILSPAKLIQNPAPVGTNPIYFVIFALFVTLAVGIGLSVLLEYMDDSIKSEADVAALLKVPTYAVISNIKPSDLVAPQGGMKNKSNVGEAPYATLNQ